MIHSGESSDIKIADTLGQVTVVLSEAGVNGSETVLLPQ